MNISHLCKSPYSENTGYFLYKYLPKYIKEIGTDELIGVKRVR